MRFWEHIEKEANFLSEQLAREDAQLGLMLTKKPEEIVGTVKVKGSLGGIYHEVEECKMLKEGSKAKSKIISLDFMKQLWPLP